MAKFAVANITATPSLLYEPLVIPTLPRVINLKFPLQPHQKYYITQYGELGFP